MCAFWFFSHSVNSLIQPHKIDINNYCNVKQSGFHLISLFLRFLSLSLSSALSVLYPYTHSHPKYHHTNGLFGKKETHFLIWNEKKNTGKELFTYEIYLKRFKSYRHHLFKIVIVRPQMEHTKRVKDERVE